MIKVPPGKNPPEDIYVIVEVPEKSAVKYELDKETGFLFVDRFLFTPMYYPFNYGFIPNTLAKDGDPVDVLVISREPVYPGSVLRCRPIGVLVMEDEAGEDEKIIAVPVSKLDPTYENINSIDDLPKITKEKIKHFFEKYKDLEPGKWVKVIGWGSKEEAYKLIEEAIKRYNANK
ncbi:MAG TPA: inorganic diphosphatase [Desulfurobacteriaceae bacterium]|nr:inorganic diphosphatase [Desulfurobacteriaceae bacterium]